MLLYNVLQKQIIGNCIKLYSFTKVHHMKTISKDSSTSFIFVLHVKEDQTS